MPTVETDRLRLRPFVLDDVDAYHQAITADPDVMRYLPGGVPRPKERAAEMLRRFIDHWTQHGMGLWAVEREDVLIGHCGLQYIPETTQVEVAYALARPAWGQGLATEAARASLRFGFEALKLVQIVALFVPGNGASERVMIKLGMTPQGTMQAYDMALPYYAIRREDFHPGPARYHLEPD